MRCRHRVILNLLPWGDRDNQYDLFGRSSEHGDVAICTGCNTNVEYFRSLHGWRPHVNPLYHSVICVTCEQNVSDAYEEARIWNPTASASEITLALSKMCLLRMHLRGNNVDSIRPTCVHDNAKYACSWCMVCRQSHDACTREFTRAINAMTTLHVYPLLCSALRPTAEGPEVIQDIAKQIADFVMCLIRAQGTRELFQKTNNVYCVPAEFLSAGRVHPDCADIHEQITRWVSNNEVFASETTAGYNILSLNEDGLCELLITVELFPDASTGLQYAMYYPNRWLTTIEILQLDRRSYMMCNGFCIVYEDGTNDNKCLVCHQNVRGGNICVVCNKARCDFKKVETVACYWLFVGRERGLSSVTTHLICHLLNDINMVPITRI